MTLIPSTEFNDLSLVRQGKVRDIFDTKDSLLMVTTDRLSAFDVVLRSEERRVGKECRL